MADQERLSVGCGVGHITFNIDLDCLDGSELVGSNSQYRPVGEVTPKIASDQSKSERIVESSITLVRCESAESAELRSR